MKKHEVQALRNKLYCAVGVLGTEAESANEKSIEYSYLVEAYENGNKMLDSIDLLCDALLIFYGDVDES